MCREMYYAYALKSKKDNRFYFGHTKNLENRLLEHNKGKNKYTRHRGPWKLVYFETYSTRSIAMNREKFFKTGKGKEYLNEKINND